MASILLSSAGRRVGLLACVRESLTLRRSGMKIVATDLLASAPAVYFSDYAFAVPRCGDADFIEAVLALCAEHEIRLIIPTIDTELPVYSASAGKFAGCGVTISISSASAVSICCDKDLTHSWLTSNGFPTVRQTTPRAAIRGSADWPLPLIAKPRFGSASTGVQRIHTALELEVLAHRGDEYILQNIAAGREFTINVYVNRSGKCICAVPHLRAEVRAGEVSKGITTKDKRLIDLARAVAEALPGAYGPLNIQCFMDEDGEIRIIEMNARFGGGYPLAHQAGARFTDWLLDELEGKVPGYFDDWADDLAMLRYDEAVFLPGGRIRTWNGQPANSINK